MILIWTRHLNIFFSSVLVSNNPLLKIYYENIVVAFLNFNFLFFILIFPYLFFFLHPHVSFLLLFSSFFLYYTFPLSLSSLFFFLFFSSTSPSPKHSRSSHSFFHSLSLKDRWRMTKARGQPFFSPHLRMSSLPRLTILKYQSFVFFFFFGSNLISFKIVIWVCILIESFVDFVLLLFFLVLVWLVLFYCLDFIRLIRKIVFVFQIFQLGFVFLFWLWYVLVCNRWLRSTRVKNKKEKEWERKNYFFIQLGIILRENIF